MAAQASNDSAAVRHREHLISRRVGQKLDDGGGILDRPPVDFDDRLRREIGRCGRGAKDGGGTTRGISWMRLERTEHGVSLVAVGDGEG